MIALSRASLRAARAAIDAPVGAVVRGLAAFAAGVGALAIVLLAPGGMGLSTDAAAAPKLCDDGTRPPCNMEVPEGEGNRLSYPVILPENGAPAGFPTPTSWTFATITNPTTQCFVGSTGGLPVDPSYDCYYDGSQVWWLSQRAANFWKAFSMAPDPGTGPVVVTAVDVGDLLESSPDVNLRRIRTEVTLLQDAMLDPRFSIFVPASYPVGAPVTPPCQIPSAGVEVGCFAAFAMSDAVPGTEQSINEIQGTDFGVNTDGTGVGHPSASRELIDPTTVKVDNVTGTGFHATVYSSCARLVIQQLTGTAPPEWDPVAGMWDTSTGLAGEPVVNVATYEDLGQGLYSAEINAGGSLIYGYNWNATRDSSGPGTYRLTFVLDGLPYCAGNTQFTADGTRVANPGEVATTYLVPAGDPALNGGTEGGLAYIDISIVKKGKKAISFSPPGGGSGGGGSGVVVPLFGGL